MFSELIPVILQSAAVMALAALSRVHLGILKKVRNEIRYIKIRQDAMDYALQRSLPLEYAKHRIEKLSELQQEEEFIRK